MCVCAHECVFVYGRLAKLITVVTWGRLTVSVWDCNVCFCLKLENQQPSVSEITDVPSSQLVFAPYVFENYQSKKRIQFGTTTDGHTAKCIRAWKEALYTYNEISAHVKREREKTHGHPLLLVKPAAQIHAIHQQTHSVQKDVCTHLCGTKPFEGVC